MVARILQFIEGYGEWVFIAALWALCLTLLVGCTPFINFVDSFHPPATDVTEIFPATQQN